MLIKDELIMKLGEEKQAFELRLLRDRIQEECKRGAIDEPTEENLAIISSRIIALRKLRRSIVDINNYINMDSKFTENFYKVFDNKPWAYVEMKLNDKNEITGFCIEMERTKTKKEPMQGIVVSCDPYVIKQNIDMENLISEVTKKIKEALINLKS